MKKFLTLLLLFSATCAVYPQKTKNKKSGGSAALSFPMQPELWEHDTAAVDFIIHRESRAVKGKNGNGFAIFLKNHVFTNGTIEFDVELIGMGFPGINFRMSPDRKNGENFYIRSFGEVTPETRTTLQYAAIVNGMSMWDLSDEYQAGATIHQQGWNHVKLVISGKQMKAYVNDMRAPSLTIPELESLRDSGGISLSGNVIYANLVVRPGVVDDVDASPGSIPEKYDTRYIRHWMVSPAEAFPFGKDIEFPLPSMYGTLQASTLPDSATKWTPVTAGSRGMVNISRLYGHEEKDVRRIAWLKTTIVSDKDQERQLNFGFSDEVWVFINGQVLYTDKNYFGTPSQKTPGGRCTIENTHFRMPLKKGNNEVLIGLANYFYGWGIIARFDEMNGIKLLKNPAL